jgi:hypothetical protein
MLARPFQRTDPHFSAQTRVNERLGLFSPVE